MKPADEVGFDVVKSGGRPFDVVMAAEIAKAITQARKEGAEDMRERAAVEVRKHAGTVTEVQALAMVMVSYIHSLPLSDEQ